MRLWFQVFIHIQICIQADVFNLLNKFDSIQDYLYSAFHDKIVAKQLYRKLSFYNRFMYCRNLIYLTYWKKKKKIILYTVWGLASSEVLWGFGIISSHVFGHLRSFKGWIQTEACVIPRYHGMFITFRPFLTFSSHFLSIEEYVNRFSSSFLSFKKSFPSSRCRRLKKYLWRQLWRKLFVNKINTAVKWVIATEANHSNGWFFQELNIVMFFRDAKNCAVAVWNNFLLTIWCLKR